MRYLLCTVLALAACQRRDGRDVPIADSTAAIDSTTASAPAPGKALSAVPDRLLGIWTAQGYDAGSKRAQPFTITWSRAPDGSLAGTIAFKQGETYNVKVVSTSDTMIVYQSDPHNSPTLKGQVTTRTRARLVGDTLMGTYEARAAKGGKVLRGRFRATRGNGG
jgi:hypothetical protein